jgi:pyruvate,orthophosphate dikinase
MTVCPVNIQGYSGGAKMEKKWVYPFDEMEQALSYAGGDWAAVRGLLGGKGANLAEMVRLGIPVPPGYIMTTEACNACLAAGGSKPEGLWEQEQAALKAIEAARIIPSTWPWWI